MSLTNSLSTLANNANAIVSSISVNASAVTVVTSNLVTTSYFSANGSSNTGSAGQVLTSGGSASNVYWANATQSFGKTLLNGILFGGQ
jgi:hypothetical protein